MLLNRTFWAIIAKKVAKKWSGTFCLGFKHESYMFQYSYRVNKSFISPQLGSRGPDGAIKTGSSFWTQKLTKKVSSRPSKKKGSM